MNLIIPILLNCILVLGLCLVERYTPAKRMPYMAKQIAIGVLFGGVSAFASSFGVEWLGAVVNVRDAAPLSAGLIFGAPAGIISGVIGGLYRWFSVYWGAAPYTRLACSIATILAGVFAAVLRKRIFENRKPSWSNGVYIAVACEVVHMILIFLTNMDNTFRAFEFVEGATVPMILGNGAAVGFAILISSLAWGERLIVKKNERRIASVFQRGLLICILVAFFVTGIFNYFLQNGMVRVETQKIFTVAMGDVEEDIREKSDNHLLSIAELVRDAYEETPGVALSELVEAYGIVEINVVGEDGVIRDSTEADSINYDMNKAAQSKEFVDRLREDEYFVQEYGLRGKDGETFRKYAAYRLKEGGFIQVGYDTAQFHGMLSFFAVDYTKNRHVGTGGFIVVLDEDLCIVDENWDEGKKHVSHIGLTPPAEMENRKTATALYYANVGRGGTPENPESHMYVFKFVEGFCIVAAMPETEATFMRDASLYTGIFMQTVIFAALFVLIYILIKRVILNNLQKVNEGLGRITKGDLDITVDVRTSREFSSLSDDINSTVTTLKTYIAEAAARIDRELEYAKQIQLSALPTALPQNGEVAISARMMAAKEVGGDFYDFYELGNRATAFLVADVSGKGIPSAMFMMRAKTIIKDLAESGLAVNDIFTRANEKLCENNEQDMFVTAWMGILDPTTGKLQFANAGHNPPLLKRADGAFEYLKPIRGLVLAGVDGVRYRMGEITLSPGDRLFLYTDGVTEAKNTEERFYTEERLLNFMNKAASLPAEELLTALKADIDAFVGEAPQFDDITMLLLDYKAENTPALTERTFPADTNALPDVLGFLEETLEGYSCSMKTQIALSVAIEEAFVNVARYAYGGGEGEVVLGIGFEEESRTLTLRMTDGGTPFDPLKRENPDITLSAEERQIGGLGIYIVKKTMDTVSYAYENEKNILTMTKQI